MKLFNRLLLILFVLASPGLSFSQVDGHVYGAFEGRNEILVGANLVWQGTSIGTTTNQQGAFTIEGPKTYPANLVISFVGFQSDTIEVKSSTADVRYFLQPSVNLSTVEIKEKLNSTRLSIHKEFAVEELTHKELKKAACCNVSESFETNASVDLSIGDAVTGVKRIQMLGLDGRYTQIQFENIPLARGLVANTGLSFIPGTWVESIQVTKGTGSVINGFEAVTGQINLELFKPDGEEQDLILNTYANAMGRLEFNSIFKKNISETLSTLLYVHADQMTQKNDRNNDGFFDMPTRQDIHLFNRWKYFGENFRMQVGVSALTESQAGGELNFVQKGGFDQNYFGYRNDIQRYEAFTKSGFILKEGTANSIALISRWSIHRQDVVLGQRTYSGDEDFIYLNGIFQTEPKHHHTLKFGSSYIWNRFNESFDGVSYTRTEMIPGVFGEYTFNNEKNLSWVNGIRTDFHNLYGTRISPRSHFKFNPTTNTSFRLSVGKAFRVPNIFNENLSYFMSNRVLSYNGALRPESAWNYGVVWTQKFVAFNREASMNVDFFRTDFESQMIIDLETPGEIGFYNLDGSSFSNVAQLDLTIEPIQRVEFKVGAKYMDVRADYNIDRRRAPLVPKWRGLLNLAYEFVEERWFFDVTNQWVGMSRIPSTRGNLVENQRSEWSDTYNLINSQIRRNGDKLEFYIGVENLLNYKQNEAIISASDPNSPEFDSGMIWAPVNGRVLYVGLNLKLL